MKCGKCGGLSLIEVYDGEEWQHCKVCGKMAPLVQVHGDTTTYHIAASMENMPRRGSKLSKTLGILMSFNTATTKDIAERSRQTTDDTASQLTVLMNRGLVTRLNTKRGTAGGSTWEPTRTAQNLYII